MLFGLISSMMIDLKMAENHFAKQVKNLILNLDNRIKYAHTGRVKYEEPHCGYAMICLSLKIIQKGRNTKI